MDNHIKMTLTDIDTPLYNEKYQMYPVIHVLSFMSPSHAILYNTFANFDHWISSDCNETQLSIMRICTPQAKYNRNLVWAKFVKKPKQEYIQNTKNEEDWLMTVYEVSRSTAQLYLQDEQVKLEIKERLKGK